MNRLKIFSMLLGTIILLSACSSEEEVPQNKTIDNEESKAESTKDDEEIEEILNSFEEIGKEKAGENEVAASEEQEYNIIKSSNMGDVVHMGDLILTFNGSTIGKMIANEDDELFSDFNVGDEMYIVAFDITLENTGDETAEDFFIASSEIVTDTKEQIKIDSTYSDSLPLDIYSATDHHATLVFFTQSPPEDINEVRFIIPKYWGGDLSNPIYEGGEITVNYK